MTIIANQRVLIIGCGYVGTSLGQRLAADEHEVTGTTRNIDRSEMLKSAGIRPAILSLDREAALAEQVHHADVVFLTVAAGRGKQDYRDVYFQGVQNLLRAAKGSPVQHIIYTSATSVYGQTDGSWVDENAPTEPTGDNGRVLVDAETALLRGTELLGITATIFRLAGIYGPGRDPLAWFKRQEASRRQRNPGAYLNLIHVDDIVEALVAAMNKRVGGVINLCDDEPMPRRDFYARLCARAGLPEPDWPPFDEKQPPDLGKRIRNNKAKQLLGLQLKHPTR